MQSLSLGYIMETDIDMKKHDICDMCPNNCEICRKDEGLNNICSNFPHISLGGCLSYLNVCKIYHGEFTEEMSEARCIWESQQESARI